MKSFALLVAGMAITAQTSPIVLTTRTTATSGPVERELENDPCRDITFIFARGSTEVGNMGVLVGPQTCDALKSQYGDDRVACQGVGGIYIADLAGNFLPEGTYQAAIEEADRLFNLAATKCPNTIVVAGGYSQGAAVMNSALPRLSASVKDQVAAAVLYGDTQNKQEGGRIPDFPRNRTLIICALGDAVCDGTLIITPAHLTYAAYVPEAEAFFEEHIDSHSH